MSTSILDEVARITGRRLTAEQIGGPLETLSEYVKRVMTEKRLTLREVARLSGGRITQGYVGGIVQGLHTNPSVEKLKALAAGLGVDENEAFRVARGLEAKLPSTTEELNRDREANLAFLDMMKNTVDDPVLMRILHLALHLSPDARATALKFVVVLADDDREFREKSLFA
jgi:transcriptional regulator with XRE-family HTH domain